MSLVHPQPAARGEPPALATYNPSEEGDRGVGADDFVGLRGLLSRGFTPPGRLEGHGPGAGTLQQTVWRRPHRTDQLDRDLLTEPDPETRLSQLCRSVLLAAQSHQKLSA